MASDLNRVTLIGRLTRDPELKYTQGGAAIGNFSIANNRTYTTSSGEKREEVSYFDCVAWGKLGEIITEYCSKGRRIAVEGRLQQRRWEDQNGNKRSKVDIVADNIQFLDSKSSMDQVMPDGPPAQSVQQSSYSEPPFDSAQGKPYDSAQGSAQDKPGGGMDNNPFSDNDIPF